MSDDLRTQPVKSVAQRLLDAITGGNPDPVKGCELYKSQGCAHVDGLLCDFPDCSMLRDYLGSPKDQKPNAKDDRAGASPAPSQSPC